MTTKKPALSCWKANAKWIFGILFFVSVGFTLLFYSLAIITGKERVVKVVATAISEAFSKKGIDDPLEIALLKRQVETSTDNEIRPIAGLDITLTPKDFDVEQPRDVRINFFSKLAAPIYEDGERGLETIVSDPIMRTKLKDTLGLPWIFSRKNHVMFLTISVILGVLSLTLLALTIGFKVRNRRV